MNLILFEPAEIGQPLARGDPRAVHLLEVLRREQGEAFDAGQVDGPRGKGAIVRISPVALELEFAWGEPPPPLPAIFLLAGLPRPQTARKILAAATALGVRRIDFFPTERGAPQYAQSSLWHTGEWRRHLVDAAAQAFCTRLPTVTRQPSLAAALAAAAPAATRIALDNYEGTGPLQARPALPAPLALALGAERGWSEAERQELRADGFALCHLGPRVLRLETAVVAALALGLARLDPAPYP